MRRTKPPVGWEHVKNCFPVPNELLEFDLPGGAIAVYSYLLRHADRRTGQCHPSTATIAKTLGVAPSSAYELMHEKDFPTLRIGNRMVVPKEKFIQWVEEHTKGGERT